MAWLSSFLRKHWIAVVVASTVALLSGLAQIWGVFTHDTIPDFIAKRGWSLTMPSFTGFGPYFLTGLLVVLQVALVSLLVKTRNLSTVEPTDEPSERTYEVVPVEELEATKQALDEAQRDRELLRGLMANQTEMLKQYKSDLACTRLKVLGRDIPNKRMTVRYLDFADNQFAEYVAATIRRYTGWQATPVRVTIY